MAANPMPDLEYLLGCTDSELRSFWMRRLERAAILEKERKEIVEELTAALVQAEVAEILFQTRRLAARPVQLDLQAAD
jgi:hypothetical protein